MGEVGSDFAFYIPESSKKDEPQLARPFVLFCLIFAFRLDNVMNSYIRMRVF